MLYDKIYSHLKPNPDTDLVIYLRPVDTLVERVHRRGVEFERRMPASTDASRRILAFFLSLRRGAASDRNSERLTSPTIRTISRCSYPGSPACAAPEFFNLATPPDSPTRRRPRCRVPA